MANFRSYRSYRDTLVYLNRLQKVQQYLSNGMKLVRQVRLRFTLFWILIHPSRFSHFKYIYQMTFLTCRQYVSTPHTLEEVQSKLPTVSGRHLKFRFNWFELACVSSKTLNQTYYYVTSRFKFTNWLSSIKMETWKLLTSLKLLQSYVYALFQHGHG